jgi:hypothetical protein
MLSSLNVRLHELTVVSKNDLPLLGSLSFVYLAYRYVMCKFVLNTLGMLANVKDVQKFTHRAFDMIHYVSSGILGLIALSSRPYAITVFWAKDSAELLAPDPLGFECTVLEKIYYLLFCAYYIVDVGYLWTVTEPVVYFIHHVACVAMITSCVVLKSPVVGLSIMLLHDFVDIPLYVGKIFLYLGFTTLKDLSFVVFVIGYAWFRITNYPMIVYHCLQTARGDPEMPTLYRATCVLLCLLYLLLVVWAGKICRIIWGIIRGNEVHDDRSD